MRAGPTAFIVVAVQMENTYYIIESLIWVGQGRMHRCWSGVKGYGMVSTPEQDDGGFVVSHRVNV